MTTSAVGKLVKDWRKCADEVDDKSGVTMSADAARHFRWCAGQLEAALRADAESRTGSDARGQVFRCDLHGWINTQKPCPQCGQHILATAPPEQAICVGCGHAHHASDCPVELCY